MPRSRFSMARLVAPLVASVLLFGCGSGGDSPRPAPQANRAPVFQSSTNVSVAENTSGTFYTAAASDADGDALAFSIAGGTDQAVFRITAGGALSFSTPPDFETPADADRDNVYLVQIGVSDGQTSATLSLAVTVVNGGLDAFRVVRVGTGFAQPLYVAAVPDGSGRVFVVEKAGRIRILTPSGGTIASAPFLDIRGQISTDGERGLLGLAIAPNFGTTGIFYVYVTNAGGDIEVRRYRTLAADRDQADAASGDVVLTFPHPGFNNHNGGWIDFGPDGFLYIASGDGGGGGDPNNNGQNSNVLLGKLLRIDVSQDAFPNDLLRDYAIPAGNPFAGGGGRPEIWALGLRNPFRNSFDRVTGNLHIGDVGQDAIEEIDLMRPSDGGANFGWSFKEGTRTFKPGGPASLVPPVTEYEHGSGPRQGFSVTGGYVYRGPVEALRGQYIFGDFGGQIWSLPTSELIVGTTTPSSRFILRRADFTPAQGSIDLISSFGLDQSGNLYIVDLDGEIYRLEAG